MRIRAMTRSQANGRIKPKKDKVEVIKKLELGFECWSR